MDMEGASPPLSVSTCMPASMSGALVTGRGPLHPSPPLRDNISPTTTRKTVAAGRPAPFTPTENARMFSPMAYYY